MTCECQPQPQEGRNPILEAIELLHAQYPTARVDIWASRNGSEGTRYSAYITGDYGFSDATAWKTTPDDAAQNLISKVGVRTPETIKANRIAQLKAQLAELEAL